MSVLLPMKIVFLLLLFNGDLHSVLGQGNPESPTADTLQWAPNITFTVNMNPFLACSDNQFNKKLLRPNVDWYSVTTYHVKDTNSAYIVYGGGNRINESSVPQSNNTFAINKAIIVQCLLSAKPLTAYKFEPTSCSEIVSKERGSYLGASMDSVILSDSSAMLVYCDPFYMSASEGEKGRVQGQCYIRKQNRDSLEDFKTVTNCQSPPCLEGLSVSFAKDRTRIAMHTGSLMSGSITSYVFPIKSSSNAVKISNTIRTDSAHFGFTVSAGASLKSVYTANIIGRVKQFPLNKLLETPEEAAFGFFGYAIETLKYKAKYTSREFGIVVSAPYTPIDNQVNAGAVYFYCQNLLKDSLYGKKSNGYFGFSLSNLGDINFDNYDDFAVSEPFINGDEMGKVYIYSADPQTCKIRKNPIQVISQNRYRFGIALSGGIDLNFNGRPDLVIASQRTNSLSVFALRDEYKAVCTFTVGATPKRIIKSTAIEITGVVKLKIKKAPSPSNPTFIDDEFVMPDFSKSLHVDQVNSDLKIKTNRFSYQENSLITVLDTITNSLNVKFQIFSNYDIEDMNFNEPFLTGYRYVLNCDKVNCNKLYKLIDWSDCNVNLNLTQYKCKNSEECLADLGLNVVEKSKYDKIYYGEPASAMRRFLITVTNNGPTEAKNVHLVVESWGNMQVTLVKPINSTVLLTNKRNTDGTLLDSKLDTASRSLPTTTNRSAYILEVNALFRDLDNWNSDFMNSGLRFNLTAGVPDSNLTNNVVELEYPVFYQPNISLSQGKAPSTVVDNRTEAVIIPEGSAVPLEMIGPKLKHIYLIENSGKSAVKNLNISLRIPVKTEDGNLLIYLFNKIRAPDTQKNWLVVRPRLMLEKQEIGNCYVPDSAINLLNIISKETHLDHIADFDNDDRRLYRARRSVESSLSNQVTWGVHVDNTNKAGSTPQLSRSLHEVVRCGKPSIKLERPVCANVVCNLPELKRGAAVRLEIHGWVFARTFFRKHISDVEIFTDVTTNLGEVPPDVTIIPKSTVGPHYISQNFLFKAVKPKILNQLTIWPIILGVILGVLFLTILIVALYKCGFFNRKYRKMAKPSGPKITHPGDDEPEAPNKTLLR